MIISPIDIYFVGKVSRAIEAWQPQHHKNEKEYQRRLKKYLQGKFPKAKVESEYNAGPSRVDIGVTFNLPLLGDVLILIELKYDLKGKDKFQTLRGQILEYVPKGHALLVVLCGDTVPNFIPDIKKTLSDNEPFKLLDVISKVNKVFLKP